MWVCPKAAASTARPAAHAGEMKSSWGHRQQAAAVGTGSRPHVFLVRCCQAEHAYLLHAEPHQAMAFQNTTAEHQTAKPGAKRSLVRMHKEGTKA